MYPKCMLDSMILDQVVFQIFCSQCYYTKCRSRKRETIQSDSFGILQCANSKILIALMILMLTNELMNCTHYDSRRISSLVIEMDMKMTSNSKLLRHAVMSFNSAAVKVNHTRRQQLFGVFFLSQRSFGMMSNANFK